MDSSIITAMISLIGTLGGSLGGILVSSKLTAYRLEQLEARVAEHNNFARRMPVIEEQIKVINHRLADIEEEEKHHEKPQALDSCRRIRCGTYRSLRRKLRNG